MRIQRIIFLIFVSFSVSLCARWQKPSSVVGNRTIVLIDPAGHARDVGRWLVEGYERAETLKFARALKKELLNRYKVYPVISRTPGEEILPLQIPSFSNRLGADFFLRIQMYREEREKPKVYLYHHLFDSLVDVARKTSEKLSLIPLNQAHCNGICKTKFWGNAMHRYLTQDCYKKYFDCYPLQGLPLQPLVGVCAPAIVLEIGLCQEHKWKNLIEPVVASLSFLDDTCKQEGFVQEQS